MARIRSVVEASKTTGSDEFVIIELTKDGPKPYINGSGSMVTFSTGAEAASYAKSITTSARKFQPRRIKDDNWHQRERGRFASKEYQPLPWADEVWWKNHASIHQHHYPHVSTKNSIGLMAFTESEDKGSADVQTAIKPGKYLERFFGDILDLYIIRDLCTQFSNKFEDNVLIYAESEDEFEELYTKGPNSCMSHPADKYASHMHPVRVYAAGDLKLAYMKRDGRIVARTLVYPAKKRYSRIYGDSGRIEPLLRDAGYKKGPPCGAKIQRVITWQDKTSKTGNQAFVLPHLDDISWILDKGDHLVLGDNNVTRPAKDSYAMAGANGISEWISMLCGCCGQHRERGKMVPMIMDLDGNESMACEECRNAEGVCESRNNRWVRRTAAVQMYDGTYWWGRDFTARGFTCSKTGDRYPNTMRITIMEGDNMVAVCRSWSDANCETCECGYTVPKGQCKSSCIHSSNKPKAPAKRAKKEAVFGYNSDNWAVDWNNNPMRPR